MKTKSWIATHRRAIAIVVLNGILAIYSIAVADFVQRASTSVVTNMYLILGWVALVGSVSFLEAAAIRDLVGRGGWRGTTEIRDQSREHVRPWRDLHLPLTIAIVTLLGINMLTFDLIAQGFFIEGQRATYAVTRMRSTDEFLRREGTITASRLKDPRVRRALVEQLNQPGPGRELATWALGKVGTLQEADALMEVLRHGSTKERAAAAVGLGRLGDARLAIEIAGKLRQPEEPIESYLYGLGLLENRRALAPVVKLMIDETTAPDHLALSAWTLGQLRDRDACLVLLDIVGPSANPLTCASLHSIRQLRCGSVGEKLIVAFEGSRPEERCDAQRFIDVDGQSYELWQAGLFRIEILDTMIRCADPQTWQWLRDVSGDGTQVPQIRDLARQATENQSTPSKSPRQ